MFLRICRKSSFRIAAVLAALVLCAVLVSAPSSPFTEKDKAYYADPNMVNFVRPGLVFKILSAEIATDGTIRARFRVTDPRGLPLDRLGVTTPGTVASSFVAATIPSGSPYYTSYTTRVQTSPITGRSATQAGADTGGTYQTVTEGEYIYTFGTKAPASIDRNATHTIAMYGSRNLTEFDMGTNYDDDAYTFVPAGGQVTTVRDVIKTASCNKCHDQLAAHGGSRRTMEVCVVCHQPQTTDPDTGESVDMTIMTHKIHMGAELPSVQAGKKYVIVGNAQSVHDYSTVGFPANIRRCEACHEQGQGVAAQAANYLTKPSRQACGACHDNVNFATGENHLSLPQPNDNQCANCHRPEGELEFDASIKGAHTIEFEAKQVPGVVADIIRVTDGVAGKKPTVVFSIKDSSGAPIPLTSMQTTPNRVGLVLAGPTTDYGYTSFGSDVTTGGYVSEDPTRTSTCTTDGQCTYTFTHAIPADAKGTFSIGIEARRASKLLAGTQKEMDSEYSAINKVVNFSVDGSAVAPRRVVVTTAKCNACHGFLSLHGTNRNQVEQCVLCHNASETDKARRPTTTNAAEKAKAPQAVGMAYMIHRIHTGEGLAEQGADYTVIGFGGSVNDFSEVRYPALTKSGAAGFTGNCAMCHVNGSEGQLPTGKLDMTNPQGPLNPAGAVTAACIGCHANIAAQSHALGNTTKLGEACATCHGPSADFSVARAHAQ
ncbi:MAG: OmcA/MtrC family decaheme c-type cytochrome [Bryobacterales bacterium]|nr:OmcA/MtrC family decaheme c-type cytochrome [Bryobacterales bacterium]